MGCPSWAPTHMPRMGCPYQTAGSTLRSTTRWLTEKSQTPIVTRKEGNIQLIYNFVKAIDEFGAEDQLASKVFSSSYDLHSIPSSKIVRWERNKELLAIALVTYGPRTLEVGVPPSAHF